MQRYNTQHAGTVSLEIYRPRRCRTRYNTLRAAVKATSFNQDMRFPMELRLPLGEWTTCNELRTCHQKGFQLRLPHNVRYCSTTRSKPWRKQWILARVLRLPQKMVQHAPRCDAVPFFAPRRRSCRRVQHSALGKNGNFGPFPLF